MATLCFATMCKNESECILNTLESVYKYIDYWIVCDTGSTDNSCEIVQKFFDEKNIPGKLFVDEWVGFYHNKTLMFERAYNKTDYVLHLDATNLLMGDFKIPRIKESDIFDFTYVRGSSTWITSSLYNNRIKWKYCGVRHNTIRCLDKVHLTRKTLPPSIWVSGEERGVRKYDPNKYTTDAKLLKEQFWDTVVDDPDGLNSRSVFYCAQSYYDSKMYDDSLKWYSLFLKLKYTWDEEQYESMLRIAQIYMERDDDYNCKLFFDKSIELFPDRAEGYYIYGKFCNINKKYALAREYLENGIKCNINNLNYKLFIKKGCYGPHCIDEFCVSLYWLGEFQLAKNEMEKIIQLPEMETHRERINLNINFCIEKLKSI